jgi:AcrR family transcriptional regulator
MNVNSHSLFAVTDTLAPVAPSRSPEPADRDMVRAFPTKQLRAEQTREKLLQTGKTLLATGGFDDISIAQIAAASGCSVGAFYMRFRSKQAYFEFLLDRVVDEVREEALQTLTPERIRGLNLEQTIQLCVSHHIKVVRDHEGLIRAALAYSINGSDDWQPIRDAGVLLNTHYIGLILRKSRMRDKKAATRHLLIGLQIITGHLINAIAHETEVMPLRHPDLPSWLGSIVLHCLRSKPAGTAPS